MKKRIILITLPLLFTAYCAFSQYIGPSSTSKVTTVKEIIDNAAQYDKTDALLKIQGYLVGQINKENYWFKDATGKIMVEIEVKQFPAFPIDEKTELILIGEVDHDLLEELEFEVESIQKVNQ